MKKHKCKLITLGILFTSATAIIHIINRIIAASSILKDTLHVYNKNYFDWRFGQIYYTKHGQGSPVLLIHDLTPGGSAYEWHKIEKDLSQNHTVYTLDLLGCGRSDKPKITYTNFIYVQLINDFIKKVIGEKTTVIASGYSGSFTIMACHSEKSLFNKIFLVNPPSLYCLNQSPDKKSKLRKFAIEIPIFGTLIYNMLTSRENVTTLFMENYYFNPFHVTSENVDAYYEAAHREKEGSSKYLFASITGKFLNLNIVHGLRSINQSIVILEGEEEPGGKEISENYVEYNPAIETTIIGYSKHFPHLENPSEFLNTLKIYSKSE